MKTLVDAIKKFRDTIDEDDYAKLGAKGKYLTVPYRLKFVREYFGERISIQTESTELSDKLHKFKANIYIDDKLVSVGESKQTKDFDKEFEKQQTVAIGRGLSILGFFGDEIATAEEMEQFLKKPVQNIKPNVVETITTNGNLNNVIADPINVIADPINVIADNWIAQLQSVAKHSKSQLYFEKNLTPIREEYKDDLTLIATDAIQQLRVDTEYNKLKSQIQSRGTNGR
tara:strand:- start:1703 stop:2389 length:687 start_codon:yes stop_codon:yes gene_type:complete